MGLPKRITPLSAAESLKIERTAELRHEYFNGEMLAMCGRSAKDSMIKMSVGAGLRTQLNGQPSTAFDSDLRIQIPRDVLETRLTPTRRDSAKRMIPTLH